MKVRRLFVGDLRGRSEGLTTRQFRHQTRIWEILSEDRDT